MLQTELDNIIEKHGKWLREEDGGVRANLSGANLPGAEFRWADLRWTNFRRANLSRSNLSSANLSRANLSEANLSRADFTRANLIGADLAGADLTGAVGVPEEIKGLRKLIVDALLENPDCIEMSTWHTYHIARCIAGLACHLAPNGRWFESQLGTASAARFLLGLLGKGEDEVFYKSNAEALEVLKGWAKEER